MEGDGELDKKDDGELHEKDDGELGEENNSELDEEGVDGEDDEINSAIERSQKCKCAYDGCVIDIAPKHCYRIYSRLVHRFCTFGNRIYNMDHYESLVCSEECFEKERLMKQK